MNKAERKREYLRLRLELEALLAAADPMGLGGPADEYSPEAAALVIELHKARDRDELAPRLAELFARQFSAQASSTASYAHLSQRIWRVWEKSSLYSPP